jgi:hypothetical protein
VDKLKLYTSYNLDKLRAIGDATAEKAVKFLMDQPEWIKEINLWPDIPSKQAIDALPSPIKQFFKLYDNLPDWIDEGKVKASQNFFEKEGNFYLSLLGFYSLPYCYAFADGAQVLVRSKRITDEIGIRLSETALFILDSFRPGTFLTNNRALITLAKVRLIHAFSRYFIQTYTKDWNKNWGLPINQEDMLGTNLAFSLLVMRGLEKLGRFPGKDTSESILHYWKIIGLFLGIEIDYWPETAKEAFELERTIRKRHLKTSDAGKVLIQALMRYYQSTIPDPILAQRTDSLISYFVGPDASAALGIETSLNLPKEVYGLFLDLSFLRQYGPGNSYEKIRSIFLEQSQTQFGRIPALLLPVRDRS